MSLARGSVKTTHIPYVDYLSLQDIKFTVLSTNSLFPCLGRQYLFYIKLSYLYCVLIHIQKHAVAFIWENPPINSNRLTSHHLTKLKVEFASMIATRNISAFDINKRLMKLLMTVYHFTLFSNKWYIHLVIMCGHTVTKTKSIPILSCIVNY